MVDLTHKLMDVTSAHHKVAESVTRAIKDGALDAFSKNDFLYCHMMWDERFMTLKLSFDELLSNERKLASLTAEGTMRPSAGDFKAYLDTFWKFHSARELCFIRFASVLDILARELLCFHLPTLGKELIPMKGMKGDSVFHYIVSYTSFVHAMKVRMPDSGLFKILQSTIGDDGWINEMLKYRHFVVHYGCFQNISQRRDGFRYHMLLPDDPLKVIDEITYDTQITTNNYCYTRMEMLADLLDRIFSHVLSSLLGG